MFQSINNDSDFIVETLYIAVVYMWSPIMFGQIYCCKAVMYIILA